MAALSDHLLVVTILAYLAAMIGYAAEYSFGSRGAVARVATRELATVGAGPSDVDFPGLAPAPPAPTPPVDRAALAGRLAVAVTVLGALVHAATLVTRGLAAGRVPWGNMYEFVLTVCLVGVVSWLVLLVRRPMARHLGLYVTLVLVVLLGFAGMRLYTKAGPLYLIRVGYEAGKRRFPYPLGRRLPASEGLERLAFRVHAFAFPIWTLAIICGAILAEAAWGRYWGWDPKETWSFVAWVVYAS